MRSLVRHHWPAIRELQNYIARGRHSLHDGIFEPGPLESVNRRTRDCESDASR